MVFIILIWIVFRCLRVFIYLLSYIKRVKLLQWSPNYFKNLNLVPKLLIVSVSPLTFILVINWYPISINDKTALLLISYNIFFLLCFVIFLHFFLFLLHLPYSYRHLQGIQSNINLFFFKFILIDLLKKFSVFLAVLET